MSRRSQHWKKGAAVTSLKALNASVHDSLPESKERICQSLASFTRHLLGYNKATKTYPPGPTPDERCQLRPLIQKEIIGNREVFSKQPNSVDVASPNTNLDTFKNLCLMDLEIHGIKRLSFDWKLADRDSWNRTMAIFIVKHWQYAESQGAFNDRAIFPAHNTEANCMGIVLRWIRGRAVDIRQNRCSPQKTLQKETRRKKRMLFKYRVNALSRLLVANNLPQEASEILPHHDCCSDTEWQPEDTHYPSVGLVWRSQIYTSIIHQIDGLSWRYCSSTQGPQLASQRFDQVRSPATYNDANAAVCPGLPENCYDPVFLFKLTEEEKSALQIKSVSSLLDILPV